MRILLIDDDETLMEALAGKLIREHYAVDIASNSEMGWEFILLFNFDLIVLDWMLPDIDGISLFQKIRSTGYKMPIMLLTARDNHNDKVVALDSGADDYVVKPFNFDELTARIRALLRRDIVTSSPILRWRSLNLNPKTHEVYYGEHRLPLTPKEYSLIELFMRHPRQVFSPGAIIDNLWAGEDPPGEEAVRTHIKGLRQKFKSVNMAKNTIETVYGVGYRLKSDREKQKKHGNKLSMANRQKQATIKAITQTKINFKNLATERLSNLESFVVALTKGQATSDLHVQAKVSAHNLAGSLGCFGFSKGSNIAKKIELLLDDNFMAQKNIMSIAKLTSALNFELQHQPFQDREENTLDKISLLIVHPDLGAREELVEAAQKKQIKPHSVSSFHQAQTIIEQESIDAVLCKIASSNDEDLKFIEQVHQHKPELPIIAIAKPIQLGDRLNIIRKGGNLILQHPVNASAAIAAVAESIQNSGNDAKVLIVDDDPQVLLSLEISLKPWGFDLTTLNSPQKLWQVLETIEPNILILDVEMPQINGIELCQILRSDRRWQHLPILFLSVHQDQKTQDRAFNIGADDYICKPVAGSILANRILNRWRRSKL
ncbi:MAG: response regulator [Pleurocapsa sp.]